MPDKQSSACSCPCTELTVSWTCSSPSHTLQSQHLCPCPGPGWFPHLFKPPATEPTTHSLALNEDASSLFRLPGNDAAAAAAPLQSYPTPCDPIDGSPPGSPVPGILQARTLERVAISFSNAYKLTVKAKSLRRVRLLLTSWSAAYQPRRPMGASRQEYH